VPFCAQVGADFHAETTLAGVADLFVRHGLPEAVRIKPRQGGFTNPGSDDD